MQPINLKADRFLALERIAVAGVSMTGENSANLIYRKMNKSCKTVIPVNPKGGTLDGNPCYADLKSIPGGVNGVVILTRPETTEMIVKQCAESGIGMVWIHKSLVFLAAAVCLKVL